MRAFVHRSSTAARAHALSAVVAALLAAGAAEAAVANAASGGVATSAGTVDRTDTSGSAGADRYARIWDSTPRPDRRWARDTAECESGRNPKAISSSGTYRGAFQFMKETWRSAPKSPGGDPVDYPYRTQAVVAVALKNDEGTSPWPVCG